MEKTLIIGLGNPILTDDGVGVKVAQELEKLVNLHSHPEITITEASAGGIRLMETMLGYDLVVLIDAYLLDPDKTTPGKIHKLSLDDLRAVTPTQHSTSPHDTSIVIALDAAEKLGYKTPRQIMIYAIEVENILDFSDTPTPAVAKAIPVVVEMILKDLGLQMM